MLLVWRLRVLLEFEVISKDFSPDFSVPATQATCCHYYHPTPCYCLLFPFLWSKRRCSRRGGKCAVVGGELCCSVWLLVKGTGGCLCLSWCVPVWLGCDQLRHGQVCQNNRLCVCHSSVLSFEFGNQGHLSLSCWGKRSCSEREGGCQGCSQYGCWYLCLGGCIAGNSLCGNWTVHNQPQFNLSDFQV